MELIRSWPGYRLHFGKRGKGGAQLIFGDVSGEAQGGGFRRVAQLLLDVYRPAWIRQRLHRARVAWATASALRKAWPAPAGVTQGDGGFALQPKRIGQTITHPYLLRLVYFPLEDFDLGDPGLGVDPKDVDDMLLILV